jgi:hypothetical protein
VIGRVPQYRWWQVAAVLLVGTAATGASATGAWAAVPAATAVPAGVAPVGAGPDPVSLGSSSATSETDDFYLPPVPLPEGRPGEVIRSRPIVAPPGAQAWRVLYHSRNLAGDDIAVSGVVVAPDGTAPKGNRPVVAWAHGTTGIADGCAPSHAGDAASRIPWVGDFLAAGYVVAATDYEGLGTPGIHPYLVGESEARGLLDAARAARALPTGAGRKVAVAGHSQGGHATLFAGEIAAQYAPELSVRGVAPGAPVADVDAFLAHTVEHHGTAGFLVLGAAGYRAAYPDLASEPLLASEAAPRADLAVTGCAPEVIEEFADDDPRIVFGRDPRTVPAWARRLRENTAGRRRSAPPVFLWQGAADDLTPAADADRYVARACARGTTVQYGVYANADHATVIDAAHDDVLAFLASRFAGKQPVDDCGR